MPTVPSENLYDVFHMMPIGYFIAVYFYITGLHMGFYTTSVVATLLGKEEWKPIGKIGAIGALVVLAVAPIFLLIDLTQPLRFWHLYSNINFRSAISWGTIFLTAYPPIGVIYAWCVLRGNYRAAKIWGLFGFPIAISVHGYTGFILALAKGPAMWNTPINPILFLVSAMVSGLALIVIILNIRYRYLYLSAEGPQKASDWRIITTLVWMMYIFLLIELFLMACDIAVLANSRVDEYEIYHSLTEGKWAPLFLGLELTLGGIIPLILLSIKKVRFRPLGQVVACSCILCGIMAMRIIIVLGGQGPKVIGG
ncbi:MAG TPA: NrfD/PsrC family molybdoenzyme membrane anchor subunit [Thermodesulfobacteriota bacterium]|nr:NrfD/PsrC family molybdoenzyme membrane anchor subunit [Thermodesulfobacteriota bacterium]